jgi:hypothetical protein
MVEDADVADDEEVKVETSARPSKPRKLSRKQRKNRRKQEKKIEKEQEIKEKTKQKKTREWKQDTRGRWYNAIVVRD